MPAVQAGVEPPAQALLTSFLQALVGGNYPGRLVTSRRNVTRRFVVVLGFLNLE
jgi:hypothetical protein